MRNFMNKRLRDAEIEKEKLKPKYWIYLWCSWVPVPEKIFWHVSHVFYHLYLLDIDTERFPDRTATKYRLWHTVR